MPFTVGIILERENIMGKLILLSNFGDGHAEVLKKVIGKDEIIFSYIPSRTELGEVYFERVKKAYQKIGIKRFNYIDIDQNYRQEHDLLVLSSDVIFLAGGDDPFIIKNMIERKYDILLQKFYINGGIIIGLCAGASILSHYSIVSDYDGIKFENINVIPWGLGLNNCMYYSRFDDACNLNSLKEFSNKYNQSILAASLDSIIIVDNEEIEVEGKVLLVTPSTVIEL